MYMKNIKLFDNLVKKGLVPPDIAAYVGGEVDKAWDLVRANILLQKTGHGDLMNTGYTLEEAQTLIKIDEVLNDE